MASMRFLVDESAGKKFSGLVKNTGRDVLFSGDSIPEVDDEDVLSFANDEKRILITADKDFGELVFKLGKSSQGIILIRTAASDPVKRFEIVKDVLDKAKGKFVVVEFGHIRIRDLR